MESMKNFGSIELGGALGGYELVNRPADKLPQELASAIGIVNSSPLLGATYQPIWYVGKQLVNGTNYLLIAEDIRVTKNKDTFIVGLVINVPPGEGAMKGEGAKIASIIEKADLTPEVQAAFDTAEKQLCGVSYKPVIYAGSQVVRGVNHYIVCEAKTIYPGAKPFAAMMCLNVFDGNVSVVGIAPLATTSKDEPELFGYAFTW